MFKRITAAFLILCYAVNIFPISLIETTNAALAVTFLVNNDAANAKSYNPGQTFSIDVSTTNDVGEAVKSAFVNVDFGNNAGFSYKGVDQRSRIAGVAITNPIPSSAYSSSAGVSYEITNASNLTIANAAAFGFNRASNSHTGFLISNSISTYQNVLTASITAQKTSDSSTVTSPSVSKTLYVNVRPHITYYEFQSSDGSTTTSSIQGDNAQTIKLVVKVKDYNGCTNIDGGTVTANLSAIGLGSSESLTYASCESDGLTAVFEKTGISTIASLGTYTFMMSNFAATDEDANVNTVSDLNTLFDDEDKKTDLSLTVVASTAPRLSVITEWDYYVGGAGQTSTTISFSGNQDGSIMVARGSDGSCNGGTTISGWTAGYTAGTTRSETIQTSALASGANNVYICLQNASGSIGSFYRTITLDTTAPTISAVLASPANVALEDSSVRFSCSEAGYYAGEVRWNGTLGSGVGSSGWLAATANTTNTYSVANANLNDGSNTIYGYCQDAAGNITSGTTTISKVSAPLSMSGTVTAFSDSDSNYDGLDGRDLTMTWTNSGVASSSNFQSYRIYLLPSNITFNSGSHTYVKLIADANTTQFTGDSTLTKDSTNSDLVSGASYQVCIAIMGLNLQLGEIGCSSPSVLTTDVVQHPTILSARFTSDTNLELTTDSTLTGTTTAHSWALISFVRNGTTSTGTNVSSINGTKINVTIPSLGSLSATGSTLIVQTGAINAAAGGFNNYFSSGSLTITDAQSPTVTAFATGTVSPYGGFYSGSLALTFQFAEQMSGWGNTKLQFTRVGGNSDASPTKIYNITNTSDLTVGTKTVTVDLTALAPNSLVSGAYYSVSLIGQDLAGNTVTSNALSPIKFDNVGPAVPSVTALTLLSTLTPTFDWLAPLDDAGNGSGIKQYNLSVYNGYSCSATAIQSPTTTALSYTLLTALPTDVANYSWRLSATDNMNNTGSGSACDDFQVDTRVPTISNQKITDTTLSSTTSMKSGDSLQVSATIPNSDAAHIWLDASSLTASATHASVQCSSPGAGITCTYVGNVVTYSFVAGFAGSVSNGTRQVQFRAQNTSGGSEQTAIASITADSTAPTVGSVITAPTGLTVWGGTSQTITWTQGGVTDNIGIAYVKLEYSSDSGSNWNLISTGANNGSRTWNVSALTTGATYQIRLTAYDAVGNSTSVTSSTFSIDKVAPTISAGTITAPATAAYVRGWQATTITWTTGNITDNAALPATPIGLEYSIDNGSNWTAIVAATANNGTYAWTAPASTNTAQAKIRLTATDSAGNTSTLATAAFIIDSTNPTVSLTYAWAGGSTPVNGKYVNSTGIDISGTASDTYLSGTVYTFQNLSNSQYWDGSSWVGSQTWNTLCNAAGTSCTIAQTISPTIANGTSYRLTIKGIDLAGNSVTVNPIDYIGDTVAPSLVITTASGAYFSGSLSITGTSSDASSGLSSVKIAIKKGSNWWNGTDWSATSEVQLATTTSNSYANWSYAFTPPGSDTSGQQYVTTVYSYDQAYKTNNSSTGAIMITLDKTAPSINTTGFWIEPPFANAGTGGVMKGGGSATIRWNSGSISDALSGLSSGSVKLEYFNGSSYVAIAGANALANSGSFSWATLPSLDTTSYILMTVTDALGNSTGTISPSFVIDSTPPTISSVTTVGDTLGQINGLVVRFSENVNTSSINAANFSYSLGSVNAGSFTIVDGQTIQLALTTATGTTASTGTLQYSGSSVTDIAGNLLAGVTKTVVDGASPIITSAEILDNDTNGKVDRIKVYWSEAMTSSTDTTAWTINNPLAGVGTAPTSVAVSSNTTTLTIAEPTSANTSTGGMSVSFVTNTNWKDTSAALNTASSQANITLSDKSLPIITSLRSIDSAGVYVIDATFSETVTGATLTGFTLSGSSAFTGVVIQTAGNTLHLLTGDSTVGNTSRAYALSYAGSGVSVRDTANNYLANFNTAFVTDGVAPQILDRTTADSDGDGHIDGVRVGFSEPVTGSLSGVTISVAGYVVTGYTTSGTGITATVTEGASFDTSVTPAIQFQNTTVADSAGNLVPSEWSSTNATDAVGPVITDVIFDSIDTLTLNFSESLSGSFAVNSFVLSGATATISSVSVTSGANTGSITLSSSGITTGTSEISFSGNTVGDLLGNKQPGKIFAKIAPTVVLNEIMWSGTGSSATQYIELHNLGTSAVDISGWKIDYGAGVGTSTLTLPATQTIAANGYYLITASAVANASNLLAAGVTADFVGSLSLDPSQTNSLVLKNANNLVYDRALAPWPAGAGDTPASMERQAISGNGLTSSNWYTAQTGSGFFDVTGPLGTPRSTNVFDAVAPTINSVTPTDNTLSPAGVRTIKYTYSDAIAMASSPSYTFKLEKNTGTGAFTDVTASSLSSSGINASTATFTTNNLAYGHYRMTFTISDAVGNQAQDVSNFYVDAPTMTVSTQDYSIGYLQAGSLVTGGSQVTVTVQTIGAGFTLSLGGSGAMQAGSSQLAAWSGALSNGFGFTSTPSGSATTSVAFSPVSPTTLETVATGTGYLTGNGNLKTYTYTIQYGAKINALQAAGVYDAGTNYSLGIQY